MQGSTLEIVELCPTGTLRVGVVSAPAQTALFVVLDGSGAPQGVTVDVSIELARKIGVPVEFVVAPNTGELTDAMVAGKIDISFMPVDDERKKRIDFGPAYAVVDSTYMATATSGISKIAEIDRPGVRVVAIAGTVTNRAVSRTLINATVTAVNSVDDAMEMLRTARAEAFALSRDALPPFVAKLPGSRIVDGAFQQTSIAIALPKERPGALRYMTAFMQEAKSSGLIRTALDKAGVRDLAVAP